MTMIPLAELVSITGGGTPNRARPEYYGGPIPWVTPKDMKAWEIHQSQETITETGLKESTSRLVPAGSVLIVIRSGVLKHTLPVAITKRAVAINQDMKALVPNPGVDAEYIARFIQSSSPRVLHWVRATTADNFPLDELEALEVPLPALIEQQRIAKQLEQIDRLRRMRRYALQMCDEVLPAAFLGMFGDPVKNSKNWIVEAISEIGEVQGGLQLSAKRATLPLKKPFLRVANVQRGLLDLSEIKQIGLTVAEFERTKLQRNDLLLVEGNGNPAEVCESACKKDPLFGVIGVQSGPPNRGSTLASMILGSRGWDAARGDDCKDPSRVF